MAGYIGSKAVNLSTTGADINGDANIDGDLSFRDNDKAIFGAGSDLQIYHDGSDSFIDDAGTGRLHLRGNDQVTLGKYTGENMVVAVADGQVELYYDNAAKLATSSTGIQVTGNIANASGDLTLDVAGDIELDSGNGDVEFKKNGVSHGFISNNSDSLQLYAPVSNKDILFKGNDNGSVITALTLDMSQAGRATFNEGIVLKSSTGGDFGVNINTASGDSMKLQVVDTGSAGAANGVITVTDGDLILSPSANVGIGTSLPSVTLEVNSGANNTVAKFESSDAGAFIILEDSGSTSNGNHISVEGDVMSFSTADSNAMRINASGHLLIGKTADDNTTAGTVIHDNGFMSIARSSNIAMILDRHDSDGDILRFTKSGTTVGSIGTLSGNLFIGSTNGSDAYLGFSNTFIFPVTSTGANRDNAISLGVGASRFDDIFATNGTIQTSDRNEKQDIAELSDAEQRVAVAAKGLMRKFRWKDAVAEKGNEARTHFGIIAQDLQAAFAAEGLDAGDYAMFISSTWTDEETGEERTRMGVRYSELLAFIIGAL